MFKLIFLLTLLLFFSFAFSFVSFFSNEWYFISVKSPDCFDNNLSYDCLFDNYENALKFGLWYMCPFSNESFSLAWVLNDNTNYCFDLIPRDPEKDRISLPNVLAKNLYENYLLDLEPKDIGQVQLLTLIGLCCLFISTLTVLFILVYISLTIDSKNFRERDNIFNDFSRSSRATLPWDVSVVSKETQKDLDFNFNNNEEFINFPPSSIIRTNAKYKIIKTHLVIIFLFIFIEFVSRLFSFILYSIQADNYLNYTIRKSYSTITDLNYLDPIYDEKVKHILSRYKLNKAWAFWLTATSLILSFICLLAIIIYFIINMIISKFYLKKYKSQYNLNNTKFTSSRLGTFGGALNSSFWSEDLNIYTKKGRTAKKVDNIYYVNKENEFRSKNSFDLTSINIVDARSEDLNLNLDDYMTDSFYLKPLQDLKNNLFDNPNMDVKIFSISNKDIDEDLNTKKLTFKNLNLFKTFSTTATTSKIEKEIAETNSDSSFQENTENKYEDDSSKIENYATCSKYSVEIEDDDFKEVSYQNIAMMDMCLEEMKSKNKKSDDETNSLNSVGNNDDDEYTDSNFGKVIIREKITKI